MYINDKNFFSVANTFSNLSILCNFVYSNFGPKNLLHFYIKQNLIFSFMLKRAISFSKIRRLFVFIFFYLRVKHIINLFNV